MNSVIGKSGVVSLGIMVAAAADYFLPLETGYWQATLHVLVLLLTAAGLDSLRPQNRRVITMWLFPLLYVALYQSLLTQTNNLMLWLPILIGGGIILWGLLYTEATPPSAGHLPRWPVLAIAHLLCCGFLLLLWLNFAAVPAVLGMLGVWFLLTFRLLQSLASGTDAAVYAALLSLMLAPLSAAVFAWPITPLQAALIMTLFFYLTIAYFSEQLTGRFRPWRFSPYLLFALIGLWLVTFIG